MIILWSFLTHNMDWIIQIITGIIGWSVSEFLSYLKGNKRHKQYLESKELEHKYNLKQKEIEQTNDFNYYRKNNIFETKSPIYRDLYKFSKMIHGTAAELINIIVFVIEQPYEFIENYYVIKNDFRRDDYKLSDNQKTQKYIIKCTFMYYNDVFSEKLTNFRKYNAENTVLLSEQVCECAEDIISYSEIISQHLYSQTISFLESDITFYPNLLVSEKYLVDVRLLEKLIEKMFVFIQCEMSLINTDEEFEIKKCEIENHIKKLDNKLTGAMKT